MAGRFSKEEPVAEKSGYLAAIQLTVPGQEAPVAALLVVQDPSGGDPGVYLVPPDVLLEGPNGEYVFAADAMAGGNLAGDLGRVVHAPIDAVYTVPASDVVRWAGSDELQVELEQPVSVDLDGHTLVVEDGGSVAAADVPAVFAVAGGDRADVTALQTALVAAALDAAALRPEGERRRLAGASPVAAGRPGAVRGARAHHGGQRRRRALPGRHPRRRGPVRLRARPRGDPGRASRAGRPRTTRR